jgi:hypothetical protein
LSLANARRRRAFSFASSVVAPSAVRPRDGQRRAVRLSESGIGEKFASLRELARGHGEKFPPTRATTVEAATTLSERALLALAAILFITAIPLLRRRGR